MTKEEVEAASSSDDDEEAEKEGQEQDYDECNWKCKKPLLRRMNLTRMMR